MRYGINHSGLWRMGSETETQDSNTQWNPEVKHAQNRNGDDDCSFQRVSAI